MHTHADPAETREWLENLDHLERIGETRSQSLEHMAAGIQALQRATATFEQLRSTAIYDVELVEGRDGRDVATFLDDSIRHARAAYAVVHTVIDKETP
jgi:pyruvate dehydrogenase complex dehydrogenase (E1) component